MATIHVGPITDVAWTDLHPESFSVCPLLCRHPQKWCILLLGQDHQPAHLNHWCWQCWQCIQLFQLAEMVDMSQSTQETLLPDGGWVGSNWQGQLCCCSPSPPSHCSPGQWELSVCSRLMRQYTYTSRVTDILLKCTAAGESVSSALFRNCDTVTFNYV